MLFTWGNPVGTMNSYSPDVADNDEDYDVSGDEENNDKPGTSRS